MNRNQVFAIADKYGAFEFGDAQGDKRLAFAADVLAAHQRTRDAAPDLLEALHTCRSELWRLLDAKGVSPKDIRSWPEIVSADAAIAKATGAK